MTLACTRCGDWHTSAERSLGRKLSCTEVKRFWAGIRNRHREQYDHIAQIVLGSSGIPFCFACKRPLDNDDGPVSG